jgi:hypothetical protein
MRGIDEVLLREITYEQYERAKAKSGYLTEEDRETVFYPSELYGYGVYGGDVIERDGKYYVRFSLGSTCD